MDVLDPQHLAECLARYIREGQARDARESAWMIVARDAGRRVDAPGLTVAKLIEDAVARTAELRVVTSAAAGLRLAPFVLLDAALLLVCTVDTGLGTGEAARAALVAYLQASLTPSFLPSELPFGPEQLAAVAAAEKVLRQTRPELSAEFAGSRVAIDGAFTPTKGDN